MFNVTIVANLVAESNILPNAAGDNGTASGIAQWHPARQAAFQAKHNKPLIGSSLAEQLEFVNYELSSGPEVGAGNKLKSAKTAADAGAAVSKYYERPLNKADEATARGQKAASIYNEYVEKSEAKLP